MNKRLFRPSYANHFFVILVLLASIVSLLPLLWTLMNSFLPNELTVSFPPKLSADKVTLDNYKYLFENTSVIRWIVNSTLISAASAVVMVYLATLAGYPLAQKKFPGSKALFLIILAFMAVPKEVLLLPLFVMMKQWHLFNSYWGLLLPTIAWPFSVFLMKQFIGTIPAEIFDAAEIDGCSQLGMFHRILLPMVKPGIGALAVFAFVHAWNDYVWQLIIVSSDKMKPLPLGVASLSQEFAANYGFLMASSCLGALPLLTMFVLFQRFFTSGITLGSVKG